MAKKTPLEKILKTAEDLEIVTAELADFAEVIQLSNNDRVKAKMVASQKRAQEDFIYLQNRIRGFVAREVPIAKLIENLDNLFS